MKEIIIKNKAQYLYDNYPFQDVPKQTDEKRCLHCDTVFKVSEYKVFKDGFCEEYICCPNAPECDGTIIDWMPIDYKSKKH